MGCGLANIAREGDGFMPASPPQEFCCIQLHDFNFLFDRCVWNPAHWKWGRHGLLPKRTTVTCNLTIATAHAKRFAHVCVLFRLQACIYCEPWLAALLPNVVAEKCQAEQAHRSEFLESMKVHLVLTDTHNLI